MPRVEIGPISEGTLRKCDLIPCFLSELERIDSAVADKVREDFPKLFADERFYDSWEETCEELPEQCGYLVERLMGELDLFAPKGMYFGATEGDDACFGFWPNPYGTQSELGKGERMTQESNLGDLSQFDGYTPGIYSTRSLPVRSWEQWGVFLGDGDDRIACFEHAEDARFFVAAPSLLSEVKESRAENEKLRTLLRDAIDDIEELRDIAEDFGRDTGDWEINLHDYRRALNPDGGTE